MSSQFMCIARFNNVCVFVLEVLYHRWNLHIRYVRAELALQVRCECLMQPCHLGLVSWLRNARHLKPAKHVHSHKHLHSRTCSLHLVVSYKGKKIMYTACDLYLDLVQTFHWKSAASGVDTPKKKTKTPYWQMKLMVYSYMYYFLLWVS